MNRIAILTLILTVTLAGAAHAAKIRVPDDHGTVQAAVDAAEAGDTVIVRRGNWGEVVGMSRKTDITIKGETGASNMDLDRVSCRRVRIEKLVVEGSSGGAAIYLYASHDVVIRKCVVRNVAGNGILVESCGRPVIEKNAFSSCGETAIRFGHVSSASDDARVRKNVIDDCGVHGIFLPLAQNALIEKNVVTNCDQVGICVTSGTHVIRKNTVADCGSHGLELRTTGNLVEKNAVLRADDAGIYLNGGAGSTLRRNTLVDTQMGIAVMSDANLLEKNRVETAEHGIVVGDRGLAVTGNVLRRNRVQNVSEDGIRLHAAVDTTLERNKVHGAGEKAVFLEFGSGHILLKNKVKSSKNGFVVERVGAGTVLERNKASGSGEWDLHAPIDEGYPPCLLIDNDFESSYRPWRRRPI